LKTWVVMEMVKLILAILIFSQAVFASQEGVGSESTTDWCIRALEEAQKPPSLLDEILSDADNGLLEAGLSRPRSLLMRHSKLQSLVIAYRSHIAQWKKLAESITLTQKDLDHYGRTRSTLDRFDSSLNVAILTFAKMRLIDSATAREYFAEYIIPMIKPFSVQDLNAVKTAIREIITRQQADENEKQTRDRCLLCNALKCLCTDWVGHNPDLY